MKRHNHNMDRYNLRKRPTDVSAIWEAAETLPKSYNTLGTFMLIPSKRDDYVKDHKQSRRLSCCANKIRGLRFDRRRYPTNWRNFWRYKKQFQTHHPNFDNISFDPQALLKAFHAQRNELLFDEPHYVNQNCPLHIMMQATADMLWTLEKRLDPQPKKVKEFQRRFRDGTHNYKRKCLCRYLSKYSYTRQDILQGLKD